MLVARERVTRDDIQCITLIFLAVLYAYSRIWVHQDDYATGLTPLLPIPYIVGAVYLIFWTKRIWHIFKSDDSIFLNKRVCIAVALSILAGLLYYRLIGDYSFLLAASVGAALYNKDSSYICRVTAAISALFFVMQVIGFYAGVFFDIHGSPSTWLRGEGEDAIQRIAFGFGHPNKPFAMLLPVWIGVLYLTGKKQLMGILGCALASAFVYLATNSRTMLCVLAIIPVGMLYVRAKREWRWEKAALCGIFPVFALFSYLLVILCSSPSNPVNQLLSGRPQWWSYYVSNGAALLGSSSGAREVFNTGLPLDNYMLDIIYRGGILLAGVISVWFAIYIERLYTAKDRIGILAVILLFVYGLTESGMRFVTAPFLPALTSVLIQCARSEEWPSIKRAKHFPSSTS